MHHSLVVGVVEGVGDAAHDVHDLVGREVRGAQVGAVDVTHREPRCLVDDPEVVHRDDARMVQGRGGAGLMEEATRELVVTRPETRDDLQRLPPQQVWMLHQVDLAHAAGAERGEHGVSGEGRADS